MKLLMETETRSGMNNTMENAASFLTSLKDKVHPRRIAARGPPVLPSDRIAHALCRRHWCPPQTFRCLRGTGGL